ncbi:hypothetical protein [Leclercia adecarboxylata]|uniref:hypothetical protein n=1 Tax=Leclercia adecarboxylata TaxID=83655 RepID=UPI0011A68B54|nr:hypothetical protein [Leclercia adecarboxylata]
MFTPHIAIVDDEITQLNDIQSAFFRAGYPCLPIHYSFDDFENASGIDHIDIKFNPRLLVTDLNLQNGALGGADSMSLVFPIYKLLEKMDISGPYVLIFWSRIPEEVESVMNLLQERFYDKINLPLFYTCIDKTDYLGSINTNKLKIKLEEIINENSLINAIFDWELRVSQAATNTTNTLFSITRPKIDDISDSYQASHSINLKKVLASIGNEAVGLSNAKSNSEEALDIGLHPVLNDHLSTSNLSRKSMLWANAIPDLGMKINLENSLKTKLNTFYHIESVASNYPKSCRGSFLNLSKDITENATKREKIEKRLGQSLSGIIEEEFLDYYKNKPSELKEFLAETTLGFIEVSAECDQAQKKVKLHRYLLAALTPVKTKSYEINLKKFNLAHNGIYKLPDICINERDYILQCSFKYQIGSIPDENIWFGDTHFRIRDQVMSELVFNFSHHISRPGIICFR